jgi:hypothetical protein
MVTRQETDHSSERPDPIMPRLQPPQRRERRGRTVSLKRSGEAADEGGAGSRGRHYGWIVKPISGEVANGTAPSPTSCCRYCA